MKTNEFIQTVNATFHISKREPNLLNVVLQIDELRKLHVRLQTKLEDLLLYEPAYESIEERQRVKSIAQEIREFANEYKIQVNFFKLPDKYIDFSSQFRNEKSFAKYFYNTTEITNLIVFSNKKRFKKEDKKKSSINEISEIQFEENFVVLDENGNDLNKIENVDL